MAVFTNIELSDVAEMLKNYNIGDIKKLKPIQSGTENTNYFIEINNNTEYLLTIFERLSADELPFYLNYTAHLAQQKIAVPMPIQISKPEKAHQNCIYLNPAIEHLKINKAWAIVEKLDGQSIMRPHAIHVAQVAANLAHIHIASQTFQPKQINKRGMQWWHDTIPELLPYLDTPTKRLLNQSFEAVQQFYTSNTYNLLPKTIAHCDLFRDNVLFKTAKNETNYDFADQFSSYYKDVDETQAVILSGFFDFYFAAHETMLYDICITINDWCIDFKNYELDIPLFEIFMLEYQKIRPLLDIEKKAMQLMFNAAGLRFWVSRLYDWHLPRTANLFKPHPPEHFESILNMHLKYAPLTALP